VREKLAGRDNKIGGHAGPREVHEVGEGSLANSTIRLLFGSRTLHARFDLTRGARAALDARLHRGAETAMGGGPPMRPDGGPIPSPLPPLFVFTIVCGGPADKLGIRLKVRGRRRREMRMSSGASGPMMISTSLGLCLPRLGARRRVVRIRWHCACARRYCQDAVLSLHRVRDYRACHRHLHRQATRSVLHSCSRCGQASSVRL